MEKKILVAIDGSPYGNNTLRYLCQLFKDVNDVHFHLLSLIPNSGGAQQSQWQDQVDFMKSLSPAGKQSIVTMIVTAAGNASDSEPE